MMLTQWKTDGISSLWPEINGEFLALRGIPNDHLPASEAQALYKKILVGFDAITSCEMKELYKFKLFLQQTPVHFSSLPEVKFIHKAFIAWVNFEYEMARALFAKHMSTYPTDVIALFFLHMLDFCTGKTVRLKPDFVTYDPHMSDETELYGYYLSMKAFVLCESKCFDEALAVGLRSVALIPDNIYGIHAVAHALHELGEWQELTTFLENSKVHWIENPGMRMHVYWHLAIAYERCDNLEQALFAFDSLYALKDSRFAKQDLDAVGFLWRLRLKSSDGTYRVMWKRLAMLWTGSIYASTSYFHKIHAAFAFSATNQTILIEKQIVDSDGFGVETEAHHAGMNVLKAIHLFTLQRYSESHDLLSASREHWHLLGGSRAQREILELTMAYAVQQIPSTQPEKLSA
ncbi:tetratricopeptide repeat protein (plasmid) [Pseudomonas sp. App30]|uniref:tetratricopeptide repeat protein n=1 Tax=Pseudomonas sp. App30 TaxID=3068990 RepID=UPI003A8054B5